MIGKIQPEHRGALYTLALTSFVMPMSMSSLNVALPAISDELAASAVQASWVVMAFCFYSGEWECFPAAWVAERVGRKRIYLSVDSVIGSNSAFVIYGDRCSYADCIKAFSGRERCNDIRNNERYYRFSLSYSSTWDGDGVYFRCGVFRDHTGPGVRRFYN